jgi:hypothetical protein
MMVADKSAHKFDIILFDNRRIETYLELINQNLILIKKLIFNKKLNSVDPSKPNNFFIPRAKHLQTMALIGLTSEHLVKIILLKRGFCINIVGNQNKKNPSKINQSNMVLFDNKYIQEVKNFNQKNNFQYLNQKDLNKLYSNAKKNISSFNLLFSSETYNFSQCIKKFTETNKKFHRNYLSFVQKYNLYKKYLGFNNLNKKNCFNIIRVARNKYIHLVDSQSECQGIYWYMYNYLTSILKTEFPEKFKHKKYIGGKYFIQNYFK